LTRVSTVSVYYGSGTAIRGNRPSITSKIRLQGFGIRHITHIPLPKWKDLEFEQDRERDEKCRIRSTKLAFDISDAGTSASLQVTSERLQAHREVILRFIERLSEVEISDMIPDLLQNHTEEISKGFEETLQTYPSIFGLGMHLDNSDT
jgi:hypothetical protein